MSHWIYHPEQEAKVVSSAEYPVFLREGWYDTPAKFPEKNVEVVKPKNKPGPKPKVTQMDGISDDNAG